MFVWLYAYTHTNTHITNVVWTEWFKNGIKALKAPVVGKKMFYLSKTSVLCTGTIKSKNFVKFISD